MDAVLFYAAAVITLLAALLVITRKNAVHALLYMVATLLSLALVFVLLAAPFAAALQVIVYAGAIMVLVIFVIMMLNLGQAVEAREKSWLTPTMWRGPAALAGVLLLELLWLLPSLPSTPQGVTVKQIGMALFGPYLIAVEAASLLLLAGLVASWHLGRADAGGA
jgi:NADH-quinone oxidoreductase subunit J